MVWFTYLLSGKDSNLNGTYLSQLAHVSETCGGKDNYVSLVQREDWKDRRA